MKVRPRNAAQQAADILASLLGVGPGALRFPDRHPDVITMQGGLTFAVRQIRSGAAGPVALAADIVRSRASELGKRVVPVLVVPFMSKAGQERCEAMGVAWLDLSGNARIFAAGIRISVQGHPNRFKQRGRPASVFAPQSARLTRWLLMHNERAWSQRELAQATHVDEGFVSRIVGKLEQDELVVRNAEGKLLVRDSNLLLDAWREEYRFDKHEIIRGHVAARSGDGLLQDMGKMMGDAGLDYAATGLGAAWLLTRFAGFRLVSFYLKGRPSSVLLERLSFREEPKGANVWLIVPNDEGVFQGAKEVDGIACVNPVQVFLDLSGHPERAAEADVELRKRLLNWSSNA